VSELSCLECCFRVLKSCGDYRDRGEIHAMEEEDVRAQKRTRKRSRSDSSDDSISGCSRRDLEKHATNTSLTLIEDPGVYGRRIPYFGENSINDILKVVSLQSFSNPRLSSLNEGERDEMIHQEDHKRVKTTESDCQSDSSEELSRKERSSSSSEDAVPSSGYSQVNFPSKSRGKRANFKNGSITNAIVGNGKDQRYWEKRQRNNASAKRSRDARRVRELETQIRAEYLEDENYRLKGENERLREENVRLQQAMERLKEKGVSSAKDCDD